MMHFRQLSVTIVLLVSGCSGQVNCDSTSSNGLDSLVSELKDPEIENEFQLQQRTIDLFKSYCVCGDSLAPFWGNRKVLTVFSPSTFEDVTNASALPENMEALRFGTVFWARSSLNGQSFVAYTAVAPKLSIEAIKAGKNLEGSKILAFALFNESGELLAEKAGFTKQ